MQAVILAAGEGVRMRPFTYTNSKPVIKFAGTTVLERNIRELPKEVREVIIVVGYLQEKIRKKIGDEFDGRKITYVEQRKQIGNGHAMMLCEKKVRGKFLVFNGDDLYSGKDIKKLFQHNLCALVKKVADPSTFGVYILNKKGKVIGFVEKPEKFVSDIANIGCYLLDKRIFKYQLKKSERGEYEITDYIKYLVKDGIDFEIEKTSFWQPIGYPWNILDANSILLSFIKKSEILGKVAKDAEISGLVKIGKGTTIGPGVVIEGPVIIGENCVIGPNCFIRLNTSIESNCHIGHAVEIKNSVIMKNTSVSHLSYVGDSVLGENVNFGAGTITANLRHDGNSIGVKIKDQIVDSTKEKLGCFIGDFSKTGVNTSLYPGVKLGPFSWTYPGACIKRDIEPFHIEKEKISFEKIEGLIKGERLIEDYDFEGLYKRLEKE